MSDPVAALRAARLLAPVDEQVARGLMRLAGEARPEVALAVAVTSRALRQGHVCLDLSRADSFATDETGAIHATFPTAREWREVLATSGLVGEARGDRRPLVLEGERLYLRRYHAYEARLAEHLRTRIAGMDTDLDGARLKAGLDRLFEPPRNGERDLQRLAALVAVMRRFCIISGGPGTGKTTTVTRILALLQEQAVSRTGKGLDIVLVAPTGKAAARLRESIDRVRATLDCDPRIKALIPSEATTIHRRLSPIAGSTTRFRHDADNPLACDVMLVDEASMVDLPLMTRLIDALPSKARLILLGDRNQLASVEAGAILGDLCGPATEPGFSEAFAAQIRAIVGEDVPMRAESFAPPIADCIVQLEKSWRFGEESGIRRLASAINAGDADEAARLCASGDFADVALQPGPTEKSLGTAIEEDAIAGYRAYLGENEPGLAAKAFGTYRVLSAHRTGPFGVEALNPRLEQMLESQRLLRPTRGWYDHRPVLVLENDYAVNLFNGDVGLALSSEEGMRVHFAGAEGATRALAPSRLPQHETVFAMTVHKAQGSEFDEVALVLPDAPTKVLTRELVYTAATRAMKRVTVFGTTDVLRAAISREIARASGLRDRLWSRP
jgi:exodeoxyribonuclease V alpha subunit